VSPSFHNKYDDLFVTVTESFGKYIPKSNWQSTCGFRVDPTDPLLLLRPNVPEGVIGKEGDDNRINVNDNNYNYEPQNDVIDEVPQQIDEEEAPEQNNNPIQQPNMLGEEIEMDITKEHQGK
jgi:hypothetical protein